MDEEIFDEIFIEPITPIIPDGGYTYTRLIVYGFDRAIQLGQYVIRMPVVPFMNQELEDEYLIEQLTTELTPPSVSGYVFDHFDILPDVEHVMLPENIYYYSEQRLVYAIYIPTEDVQLIYDRTETDLMNETDKAFIDYNDLNRLGYAQEQLENMFKEVNYRPGLNLKRDWDMDDARDQHNMDVLKYNLSILRGILNVPESVPKINAVTYKSLQNANNVEKLLYDVRYYLRGAVDEYTYSGDSTSGGTL